MKPDLSSPAAAPSIQLVDAVATERERDQNVEVLLEQRPSTAAELVPEEPSGGERRILRVGVAAGLLLIELIWVAVLAVLVWRSAAAIA